MFVNHLKRQFADMFHMDRAAVDLSKSTLGIAIVLVALILLSTIGAFGFTMAFGAVLAVAFDGGGPRRQRVAALIAFALAGALATLLGNGAGQSIWGSITVIFVVTLVCGLALALGPQAGKIAFFINLWMMISLSLSSALYAPINLALGFFCGSGIVAVAVLLLMPKTDQSANGTPANTALHWSLAPLRAHLNLHSPIMQFALSRALVASFAMWLGWWLALAHPFWIAMTVIIVVVPDRQQAARTSWQRAIGTVIGVAIGALTLMLNLAPLTLLLLWLLVTLLMLAVQGVNYVLYAAILTLNLILFYQLLEADVLFSATERLVTTLLGIAFALGIIALLEYLSKRQPGEPAAG
jgi:hypothetical protein